MTKPMKNKSEEVKATIEAAFPCTAKAIAEYKCTCCKKPIGKFRDALSQKEYRISGMCQNCQDSIWGEKLMYNSIFTDFDYDYIALGNQLGSEWIDTTYGGDPCPSFGLYFGKDEPIKEWYILYFDYQDPKLSEHFDSRALGEMKQFEIVDEHGNYVFQSDNWEEVKQFVLNKGVQQHYNNKQEARATDTDG